MGQGERRQDFPTLWEGVGPDTPIPNEAKGEYAKLNYWGNSPEVPLWEVGSSTWSSLLIAGG